MLFDNGWERFHGVQNVLLVLCLSLSAIFLVNLYEARRRFIKLKTQGLVSYISESC